MSRYFFDHSDTTFTADVDGAELGSLPEARRAAFEVLCGLMKGRSDEFWSSDEWEVQCRDARGLRLFTLTVLANDAPAIRQC